MVRNIFKEGTMATNYGYIRVSSYDQNEDRQLIQNGNTAEKFIRR